MRCPVKTCSECNGNLLTHPTFRHKKDSWSMYCCNPTCQKYMLGSGSWWYGLIYEALGYIPSTFWNEETFEFTSQDKMKSCVF